MAAVPGVSRRASVALPFHIDRRMLAGIVLVGLSVAASLILWRGANDTTTIVVAATDIQPGHVIRREDLRLAEARLDGGLASIALAGTELETAVGRTAGTTIHAGEMLVRPDLASGPVLGPDQAAVTIPVQTDTIYPGLRPSDVVAVIATSAPGKPESKTVTLLDRAVVFDVALERRIIRSTSIGDPNEDGEVTNITLAVSRSEAEALAHAIVNSKLTVVLLSRQEPGSQPPGR